MSARTRCSETILRTPFLPLSIRTPIIFFKLFPPLCVVDRPPDNGISRFPPPDSKISRARFGRPMFFHKSAGRQNLTKFSMKELTRFLICITNRIFMQALSYPQMAVSNARSRQSNNIKARPSQHNGWKLERARS